MARCNPHKHTSHSPAHFFRCILQGGTDPTSINQGGLAVGDPIDAQQCATRTVLNNDI